MCCFLFIFELLIESVSDHLLLLLRLLGEREPGSETPTRLALEAGDDVLPPTLTGYEDEMPTGVERKRRVGRRSV